MQELLLIHFGLEEDKSLYSEEEKQTFTMSKLSNHEKRSWS